VRDLAVLFLHLLVTVARLAGPGGARSVVAESVLVRHQLLVLSRSRSRSPNLRPSDRMVAGLCAVFIRPGRLIRSAITFKPSTLLRLRALIQRKYRRLFSSKEPMKPGPKGPSQEVIAAVVDMKQRNPSWGCPRIAQQITLAFGIPIDRDVVRRILAARYEPTPNSAGPSWLTALGHAKDSLWSVDLFRCESAVLHTYWVLVVMDHWTRRIVGFGVHRGVVDGVALCRMFNHATRGESLPTYLSADHDPLYRFHQWQANLRILNIQEIKTVPYVPRSHPVVERLIGTVGANIWIASCSGPRLISSGSSSSSSSTTTTIAHIRGGQGARRRRARTPSALGRVSERIGGSRTVVGCITHRAPRDVVNPQRVHCSDLRIRHSHPRGRVPTNNFVRAIEYGCSSSR
jgi:putative transposase